MSQGPNALQDLLRQLPQVGEVMQRPEVAELARSFGHRPVREAVRQSLEQRRSAARSAVAQERDIEVAPLEAGELRDAVEALSRSAMRPVINATGVVLHTNLGRAPLAPAALDALAESAGRYLTVEYELHSGKRGNRNVLLEPLIQALTGCEAAAVVNNNAAAVLLMLSAVSAGREVIVSRSELVEIGGSFRIPDVMAASGCQLVEVGTTNRTHLRDYAGAVSEATGALMKVHRSNFRIEGFTKEVGLSELAALGREHGVPVMYDCGSGSLVDLTPLGIHDEAPVPAALAAGVDLISFSGDKLLGGPQVGIIAGRQDLVEACRKHPLMRALRPGRLTLVALEATLRQYRDADDPFSAVPGLRMLSAPAERLKPRAEALADQLREPAAAQGLDVTAQADAGAVGGGAAATTPLPTWTVALVARDRGDGPSPDALVEALRGADTPVIARIREDRVLLDMRTVFEQDEATLSAAVLQAAERCGSTAS